MKISQEIAETIVDPKAYADWPRIDGAFQYLRREAPFARAQPNGYDPFWVVTRHADVLQIERQSELFRSGNRPITAITAAAIENIRQKTGGSIHTNRTLVHMDNPDHVAYRRLTHGAFLPGSLRQIEARVSQLAKEAVDKMASYGGECDFANDVAFAYPLQVIMELMGLPREDEPFLLKLTQHILGANDPARNRSGAELDRSKAEEDRQRAFAELMQYFVAIAEDRKKNPRNDVSSLIANGEVNGCPVAKLEGLSYFMILATAGHDTTSNSIAGGVWALAKRPALLTRLKSDMSLIPGHGEEFIRWETPVKHFMRTASADVEFAGQQVSKGDWLMLCYSSANRDAAAFKNPFEFEIDRRPNNHVAFGYGPHTCLGQHLGRMEIRFFWEELLPRLNGLELNGKPTRTHASFVSGPKSLPVRYQMN